MKLISYLHTQHEYAQLAIVVNGKAYNTNQLDKRLPNNMAEFLLGEDDTMVLAKAYDAKIKAGDTVKAKGMAIEQLPLMSPIPYPSSLRFVDAFATSKSSPTHPSFQFGNHNAIQAGGDVSCLPDVLHQLSVEVQLAAVVGVAGVNIRKEEAEEFIAGYTLLHRFRSYAFQAENSNSRFDVKGADFISCLGPFLVTPDELITYKQNHPKGRFGSLYDLTVQTSINGLLQEPSRTVNMQWTIEEVIEYCSYGIELLPGDVIALGTPHQTKAIFLKNGDVVEGEIASLGKLSTRMIRSDDTFSILSNG